jgi:hypothetical protein
MSSVGSPVSRRIFDAHDGPDVQVLAVPSTETRTDPEDYALDRSCEILGIDSRLADVAQVRQAYHAKVRHLLSRDGATNPDYMARRTVLTAAYEYVRRRIAVLQTEAQASMPTALAAGSLLGTTLTEPERPSDAERH